MSGGFVVTGATGPVAEATIRRLADRGDALLLTGRNEARLRDLVRTYSEGGQVGSCVADITTPDGARAIADAAERRWSAPAGLIHMVGSFRAGPVASTEPEQYEQVWDANFLSAVRATRALLPMLGDGGRLVYFGTPLATEPLPGLSAYAAAKAALVAWVRSLSHEVKQLGVHANVVLMTMADTPRARAERPDADFDQAVTPELVSGVVDFLTSPDSDGLYGAVVPVLGRFGFGTSLSGRTDRS